MRSLDRGTHRASLGNCGKCKLAVIGQAGDADADETKRTRTIAERAVEEAASELSDLAGIVDADAEGRRAAPDREVRVPEFRRDRPRRPPGLAEVIGDPRRHA